LKNRQEEDDQKMILDPQTVKVVKVYKDLTEMELLDIMSVFGEVTRVKIPFDDNGGYRGIAFATFKNPEDCQKVIAEGYIKYDFYELPVEQATMSLRQRERNEQQRSFGGDRGERRGGFGDRDGERGGYRRGGFGDREGGDRRGGYGERRGGYGDREGGDRRGGYGERRGGYGDREGGRGGYGNRDGGYGGNRDGGYGGNRDGGDDKPR